MRVTDGAVVGELQGDLVTIHILGIQHYQGLSVARATILLDTIVSFAATEASYLFTYREDTIHSTHVPALGRVLSALLGR